MIRTFSLTARVRSFGFALDGLWFLLRTQHNAWLHFLATAGVCGAAYGLEVSAGDWAKLILAITLVWMSETINTAFEHLCDVVSPELREPVKRAKDIAAGAVLISASGAALMGAVVFAGYL